MMSTPDTPLWEVFIRSRNGLAHKHVGSLHAADPAMALQAARDVYTRRGEGLSIWVVPSERHYRQRPGRQSHAVRARREQDLPPPDLLRSSGRSRPYVMPPLVLYVLRRADDALVLGHRLSEWCGFAPTLEEDMALANVGLDLLGQARSLYSYAAEIEGGRTRRGPFRLSPRRAAIPQTYCCWSSPTVTLPGPSSGSFSIPPSPIGFGGR